MRRIIGIVAGVAVAMLTISIVEYIGHQVYPRPTTPSASMAEAAAAYVSTAPVGALFFVVAAWFSGVLLGGWVALAVARWTPAAWIIGGLIAAGGIFNATQIPAPLWMQLSTVLAPALGAFAALHLPGWRVRSPA